MQNNIGTFITKRASLNPTTDAVVDLTSGVRLTYRELNERCNRVAHALTTAGHQIGDRVATLLFNGPSSSSCSSAQPRRDA